MKIVAGLGNPGVQYETTRHNVGFLAVDRLVEKWKATRPSDAFEGEVCQASVKGEKTLLVKPQTYMNDSGTCLGPLLRFYKCAPDDLIVIHDDLDLKSLSLRIKTGGGTGGHNGLKSIDAHLGSQDYHRVRIGIGRPQERLDGARMSTVDFVLQPFSDEELKRLDPFLDTVAEAVEKIVEGDIRGAMNQFNREGSK